MKLIKRSELHTVRSVELIMLVVRFIRTSVKHTRTHPHTHTDGWVKAKVRESFSGSCFLHCTCNHVSTLPLVHYSGGAPVSRLSACCGFSCPFPQPLPRRCDRDYACHVHVTTDTDLAVPRCPGALLPHRKKCRDSCYCLVHNKINVRGPIGHGADSGNAGASALVWEVGLEPGGRGSYVP